MLGQVSGVLNAGLSGWLGYGPVRMQVPTIARVVGDQRAADHQQGSRRDRLRVSGHRIALTHDSYGPAAGSDDAVCFPGVGGRIAGGRLVRT